MLIEQFATGGDRNFAYLIADESAHVAATVDPSYQPERLVEFATGQGFEIVYSFCTHDHHDHTNGNPAIERLTGCPPLLYGRLDPRTGARVEHGARFPLGEIEITVLHTPGHTQDSICLLVPGAVLTGDTLFVGKVGGTGFGEDAEQEFASLHERLLALPDGTRVLPGHDVGVAKESTIGHERRTNPFLTCPDLAAFVHLKRTWTKYKREHGIA